MKLSPGTKFVTDWLTDRIMTFGDDLPTPGLFQIEMRPMPVLVFSSVGWA